MPTLKDGLEEESTKAHTMYIVYGGQSANQEHCISQLASVLAEKYLVIKPPQNHILNVLELMMRQFNFTNKCL